MSIIEYLDSISQIDWNQADLYPQIRAILDHLSEDRAALKGLITSAAEDAALFRQFECHAQFDRFVLYDALKSRGFRVRLHIWHDNKFDLPHQHRYCFATKILRGGYHHVIYTASPALIAAEANTKDARPYQQTLDGPPKQVVFGDEFRIRKEFETFHGVGDVYWLSPDILHSSRNTKGNVTLFIRGPAVRDDALELELDTGKVFRRNSMTMESEAHRADVQMSREQFWRYVERLEAWEII